MVLGAAPEQLEPGRVGDLEEVVIAEVEHRPDRRGPSGRRAAAGPARRAGVDGVTDAEEVDGQSADRPAPGRGTPGPAAPSVSDAGSGSGRIVAPG